MLEHSLCLSQYFVNKQNIRSFKNLVHGNLLKDENFKHYLLEIFEDNSLVSLLPVDLKRLLATIQKKLKEKSKNDFRNYFSSVNIPCFLLPVDKEIILNGSWRVFCNVFPTELWGNNHNSRIVQNLLRSVVYSFKGEHLILSKLYNEWDYNVSAWTNLAKDDAVKVVNKLLGWILKKILAAIISLSFYVTTCKMNADDNKLYFFWKNQWQSFYDKKVSEMQLNQVLQKNSLCLGKRTKKSLSFHEIQSQKQFKKGIPKLYLIFKGNNEFRPIVRYKINQQNMIVKNKLRERLQFLKTLIVYPPTRLESQYNALYNDWINMDKPKLYFVKSDLTNAFGSIDKEKLMKILRDRYMQFLTSEEDLQFKKKMARQFQDFLSEIKTPLLIRAGSTIFEWKRGLVQGYKYSPALSELYYSYMDEQFFTSLLKKDKTKIKLFTRVVDDYLFVTDSLDTAKLFLEALSNYKNVNYDKTVVNFENPMIQQCSEISFLGYTYNTTSLQVGRANNVYSGQMCYKIAFSNSISNTHKFLENRIGQSGIQINGHLFNFLYNDEKLIWQHIFTTLCLSANKFCTILAILCAGKEMSNYLSLYKKRVTVKLCNAIIETLMNNKPPGILFIYCINHFRYLSWQALLLCAKNTYKCNVLLSSINVELAKSNCIYGKWKEHASRINCDGSMKSSAVREVCRRSDLRIIMKSFNVLPNMFECYSRYIREK